MAYHYDQAEMKKELIQYLRKIDSRYIKLTDRQGYLRVGILILFSFNKTETFLAFLSKKHRCDAKTLGTDGILNQRAYICNICASQFRLGPSTASKSACLICTNIIMGAYTGGAGASNRFEARLCQKHGSMGYPAMVQCILCKLPIPMNIGKPIGPLAPAIANICMECYLTNRGVSRCCAVE